MPIKIIILLFITFINLSAFSKIIVISDIDDTIKKTNVKSLWEMARNVSNSHNFYPGIPEVFQAIADNNEDVKFFYISNAMRFFVGDNYDNFLEQYFPHGKVFYKPSLFHKNHKFNSIKNIVITEHPDVVIYLGDNSERDPSIYAMLAKEFPTVKNLQFIRAIHSINNSKTESLIRKEQLPFYTPLEITYHLYKNGILENTVYNELADYYTVGIINEFGSYFPHYFGCGYWSYINNTLKQIASDGEINKIIVHEKIKAYCKAKM